MGRTLQRLGFFPREPQPFETTLFPTEYLRIGASCKIWEIFLEGDSVRGQIQTLAWRCRCRDRKSKPLLGLDLMVAMIQ